jgi:hypothetical protein
VCELYKLGGWARESIAGTNADWNAFVRPTVVVCCTVVSLILRTSAKDAGNSQSTQVSCRPENMCQRTSPIAQRLSTMMSSLITGIYFAKMNIDDQLVSRIRTRAWLAYLHGTHNCILCHHTYIYLPQPPEHEQGLPHTSSKNFVHCNNYVIAHLLLPAKQPNLAFPSSLVPYRSAPDTVCPPRTLLGLSWTRRNCVYLPDMYVLACNLPDIHLRAESIVFSRQMF